MYLLRISRNLHVIAVSAFSIKSYRTQGTSNGSSGCSDLVSWMSWIFKCLKGPFPMTKDGMPQTFASWPIISVLHPHIVPHSYHKYFSHYRTWPTKVHPDLAYLYAETCRDPHYYNSASRTNSDPTGIGP